MDSKVRVVTDESGTIIHQSNGNPEYGYIRLEQDRTVIDDESGFLRRKVIRALLHGTIEDLKLTGFESGQELPGTIVVQEALEPFNKKDPEREIKKAGKTGVVLKVDGQPIYRRTIYTNKQAAEDVIVKHDNKRELQEAYAKQKASEDISQESGSAVNSSNSDFNLDITD
jgi:hypothetical protein